MNKRDENDIWKNLYDFPLIETAEDIKPEELIQTSFFDEKFRKNDIVILETSEPIKHILSHQILYIRFIKIEMQQTSKLTSNIYQKVPVDRIKYLPVPVVIGNYIDKNF